MNVFFITVESLSSKYFRPHNSNITPNISKLMDNSFFFPETITSTTFTKPSIASIFTSTYPASHGLPNKSMSLSNYSCRTIAEILSENGVCTAGFSGYRGLCGHSLYDRGFDYFRSSNPFEKLLYKKLLPIKGNLNLLNISNKISQEFHDKIHPLGTDGKNINKFLFRYLANELNPAKKNFVWLYYFDMHLTERLNRFNKEHKSKNDSELRYLSLLKYQDRLIGNLVSFLKKKLLFDNSFIVIVGDHGEGLGEREGFVGHGVNVYEELIKVPLLISSPLIDKFKMVKDQVRTIDIAPTIMSLFKIKSPKQFIGKSLIDFNGNLEFVKEDFAVTYCNPVVGTRIDSLSSLSKFSVRRYPYKLIKNKPGSYEFYDLENDPNEKKDLYLREKNSETLKPFLDQIRLHQL